MRLKKIAIGVALASGTMAAQAGDVAFFPYVVSGGSVTTLVSMINGASLAAPLDTGVLYYNNNGSTTLPYNPATGNRNLHWVFEVKSAESPGAVCSDFDGYFPTSPLDIVTYDVSGVRGNNGLMFENVAATSNIGTGNNAYGALRLENGKRGTLFVHNAGSVDPVAPPLQLLSGDALIVEFDTGAAWGYAALVNHSVGPTVAADFNFGPQVGALNSDLSFAPQNEVTTRIFITPVNNPAAPTPELSMLGANGQQLPGNASGSFSTTVRLVGPSAGGSSISVFDRDESGFSSSNPRIGITCVYPADIVAHGSIPGLVTSVSVLNYVMAEGGWTRITTEEVVPPAVTAPPGTPPTIIADPAVAIKLDFRPAGAGGQFEMPAGVGAFNNSFMLNPRAGD